MLALPNITAPAALRRAAAGAHAVRAENIFMNEGDAEQRSGLARGSSAIRDSGFAKRQLRSRRDYGVQAGVQAFDARQEMAREFDARQLP